jgi:phosphoribosyl 1,2-cyclic phosphate phosphodiesterase
LELRLFEQDHGSISSLGFRIGDFAYSTDVVALDERALDILQGVDVWVVDCFQRNPLKTHAHPEKVAAWIERLKPKRVILTHMGYDMDWRWMCENLLPAMEPAFDGMVIDFDGDIR